MTRIKAILGSLVVMVAVVGGDGIAVAQASASRAPIVITYEKTCNEITGYCTGTAMSTTEDGGTIVMQVTSFRATETSAKLTATEEIIVGDIEFTAEMKGNANPAGFIVLKGKVTEGSFVGARVDQRSDLVGVSDDGTMTDWIGQLRVLPSSG